MHAAANSLESTPPQLTRTQMEVLRHVHSGLLNKLYRHITGAEMDITIKRVRELIGAGASCLCHVLVPGPWHLAPGTRLFDGRMLA